MVYTGADGNPTPLFAAYGATKRGLAQLGKSLRVRPGPPLPCCVLCCLECLEKTGRRVSLHVYLCASQMLCDPALASGWPCIMQYMLALKDAH